jgi:hypothetical protein
VTLRTARARGIIFLPLLIVMVVVAMLTAVFLKRSQGGLFQASHYRDSVRAQQAAKGGANHVIALLEQDSAFDQPIVGKLGDAAYSVTFDPAEAHFSVNNLEGDSAAGQASFQGHQVAPHSADIIVVGTCGLSRQAIRVVVQQGLSSLRSVAAVGRVELSGDVLVDGVKSLKTPPTRSEPEPAPGGILSKHRTTDVAEPAIVWSDGGSNSFTLGDLSRLETAPADSGVESISENLRLQFADQIIDQGAADAIPDIDVNARVTAGLGNPALAAGGSTLTGYTFVQDQRSVDGDLTVNGDLLLSDGTLFVDGDLTINGGVEGIGSLYVSGNVTIRGGNAVVQASQPAGAAILAGGNVSLEGLNAFDYLAIMAADPSIAPAYQALISHLNAYEDAATASALWSRSVSLSKHLGGSHVPPPGGTDVPWVNPVPGLTGTHALGYSNGVIPNLTLKIKATGHHLSDPRAAKVIRALEEMAFHFRDNDNSLPPFVDSSGTVLYSVNDDYSLNNSSSLLSYSGVYNLCYGPLGVDWEDQNLPDESRTHSSIAFGPGISGDRESLSRARRDDFLRFNPLDFSWLGDSAFQGLVYARGSISADTRFKVIGSLISLGDVSLTNGSTLIFNEEYRSLFGQLLPLGVVHVEEL